MTVAVLFGGKSCEHDISVITAVQIMQVLDSVHKLVPIYIDGEGSWWTGKNFDSLDTFRKMKKGKNADKKAVHFRPNSSALYYENGKKHSKIDVCILANHGVNGEDGTLQGLLELSGIAYTGGDVRSSAVGMDKIMMKEVFRAHAIPIVPYVSFDVFEYEHNLYELVSQIKEQLTFPLMVKPSNLGSSIGISKVKNWEDLFGAIRVALSWDNRVIIENALEDFTELNCACLHFGDEQIVSEIEKPVGWKEFLTFDDKYMTKNLGSGREFPAVIDDETRKEVKRLTKVSAKAVGCLGVSRVDFLLTKEGDVYVNEINTIPGAMANYLFDYEGGIAFKDLIERAIEIAIVRKQRQLKLTYSYKAPLGLKIQK